LPREVNTLMVIVRIKALCRKAGISRLDVGPKGATVQFHNDKFGNPAGLVEFVRAQGQGAKIAGNKIVLVGEMKAEGDRIKTAFAIARDLAEKIVKPKGGADFAKNPYRNL
jgi:transcription-repair coupling factor (superfamily II helicase)